MVFLRKVRLSIVFEIFIVFLPNIVEFPRIHMFWYILFCLRDKDPLYEPYLALLFVVVVVVELIVMHFIRCILIT